MPETTTWQRPGELSRLLEALRATEPRPSGRWSDLVEAARRWRAGATASGDAPR
ncbi:hypothetical protein [Nocardioides sp. MH1]|uniref:hypothetical protein n=1 Tax=Nocardioides sp. MH1 TaxID=3242490 RepID=UPI003523062F